MLTGSLTPSGFNGPAAFFRNAFASRFSAHDEVPSPPDRTPLADDIPAEGKRRPRALVVDDAPDVTEMITMLLRYTGYDVAAVLTAPDALEKARSEDFDVVVSDIGMPGMSGYELAMALRSLDNYVSVPLIAMTGFAMYDDRERALESGFDAFLTKPINLMDLIDLIRQLRS
ncbi:MAG: response regulator [Pyrinomonadaceae bacterium]|nr:response regulator [Pyrinomonadaceae bacterium]